MREGAANAPRTRGWLVGLTLAAFVLRLAWLFELARLPWFESHTTDSLVYDRAAQQIAGGDWLLGHRPMVMSPGYFYALGATYTCVGAGPWPVRLLQIALGSCAVPLAFAVARRVLEPLGALIVAGIVAFAGPLIFFDGMLLPESASTVAILLLALSVLHAREAPSSRASIGVGLVAGLAAVLRPNVLVVIPVVAWLVAATKADRRSRAATFALVVVASLVPIVPITARNFAASDRFVLLTAHGGLNLFIGDGPGATGTFRVPPEVPGADSPVTQFVAFERAAAEALGHPVDAVEADRYWTTRVVSHVAAHPFDTLVLFARKGHLFFNARDLGLVVPHEFARRVSNVLGAPLVQFGWVAPFGLVGMLLAVFAARDRAAHALGVLTSALVLSVLVVFVTDRYRSPLLPELAVLGVWLVSVLKELLDARAKKPLALLATALGVAFVLAVPAAGPRHFERDYARLAEGLGEMGESERAHAAIDEGLRIEPDALVVRVAEANVLDMEGDRRATEAWIRVRDLARAAGDTAVVERAELRLSTRR